MKIYQVGGCVRDRLRGQQPQDYDHVVVGSSPAEMLEHGFIQVGRDFPVFLHPETKQEYALARKEIKTGNRHTDFRFIFDPSVTLEEDLERRDFTCNALAFDPQTEEIIDPFGGVDDIKKRILRHIHREHFQEDPLRILRLCRFAAQLGYTPAAETMELVTKMTADGMLDHLTPERVWKELEKALRFPDFPQFVRVACQCGALKAILPEVEKLWQTPERTDYHPEGNSGEHTVMTLEQAADTNAMVRFALLLHDIGKTVTPAEILPSHHNHEQNGLPLIRQICKRLRIPNHYRDFALIACRLHMKLCKIPEMRVGTLVDFCEDLVCRGVSHMDNYIEVCRADMHGCKRQISPEEDAVFEQNAALLRQIGKFLADIRAADMPGYSSLPKDHRFGELYRQYRIRRVREFLTGLRQQTGTLPLS